MKTPKVENIDPQAVPVRDSTQWQSTLAFALKARRISQSLCAKLLCIGVHRVNAWVRGKVTPTTREFVQLGKVLGITSFKNMRPKRKNYKRNAVALTSDLEYFTR